MQQGILPSGSITGQYRPCTVHYTPAHWEKFYYLWLHLISSHLGSGTHRCHPASQSEASIGAADQWEAGIWVELSPLVSGPSCRQWLVSPGPRSRLRRPAQPGPACTGSTEFVLVSSAQLKMRIRGLNQLSSRPASTLPLNNPPERNNRLNPLWEKFSVSVYIHDNRCEVRFLMVYNK